MKAKEFVPVGKPRNYVAKNAMKTTSGAGQHKDKKRADKQGHVKHTGKEYTEGVDEAAYAGNLGLMELFSFFSRAGKTDPELVTKVKQMIKQGEDKLVWQIVQDYTDTKLVGKEFEGSIAEMIKKTSTN